MRWTDLERLGSTKTGGVSAYKHKKRLAVDPEYWDEVAAVLFDTEPLRYDISVVADGMGDATPFLLPAEAGPPRDVRAEAHDRFASKVAAVVEQLAVADPVRAAALQERWDAWWAGELEDAARRRRR